MKYLGLVALLLLGSYSSETKFRPAEAAHPAGPADTSSAVAGTPVSAASVGSADTSYPPDDRKTEYQKYDFGPLWELSDDRPRALGFIGEHYERLRIVLLKVRQDPRELDLYHVTGKSRVGATVHPFEGTIRLLHVWDGGPPTRCDGVPAGVARRGQAHAAYELREVGRGPHTGVFTGVLTTDWLLTKNYQIRYDDLGFEGDDYANNQFAGHWRRHDGKVRLPACWGDYRIANAGPLDVGTYKFVPNEKYAQYGWQSYLDALRATDQKGWAAERAPWW